MADEKRWFDTGCLRAKPTRVDAEAGIIYGVKVCTEGEAKGHGYHIDAEFVETVCTQGNALKRGLKARFGHPNMCSDALGTFLGRFKNFSCGPSPMEGGNTAATCFADLHLSDTAKDAPSGDLYSYIIGMAEKESDVFGSSIVFTAGSSYRKNEQGDRIYPYNNKGERNENFRETKGPDYVECETLHACDCVDSPAVNDGLFSAFSAEAVAGQITEFLDLNPQIFDLLQENPAVMEAISCHGERFEEFITKYQEHRRRDRQAAEHQLLTREAEMAEEMTGIKGTGEQEGAVEDVVFTEVLEKEPVNLEAAIEEALTADRKRQAEIRELGAKFGFVKDAEQFARDGGSLEMFRAHILDKSPEAWRTTLSLQNPATQESETSLDSSSEADAAVARIKEKRQARFGSK